mmetsp:Transcript_11392/g.20713  ORF Transcript_11392/g.20713 Transcript_11392/m.20713 type:complete len:200 (-) Transcript_11392:291-890(-)
MHDLPRDEVPNLEGPILLAATGDPSTVRGKLHVGHVPRVPLVRLNTALVPDVPHLDVRVVAPRGHELSVGVVVNSVHPREVPVEGPRDSTLGNVEYLQRSTLARTQQLLGGRAEAERHNGASITSHGSYRPGTRPSNPPQVDLLVVTPGGKDRTSRNTPTEAEAPDGRRVPADVAVHGPPWRAPCESHGRCEKGDGKLV